MESNTNEISQTKSAEITKNENEDSLTNQNDEKISPFSEEEMEEEEINEEEQEGMEFPEEEEETPKINSIKLTEIPTWSEFAPDVLKGSPAPDPEEILYPVNDEINKLISYLPAGDSTSLQIDAIVNAANSHLYPGGGICGVIHSHAGRKLEKACAKIGHCDTGHAVVTPGFNLPAKYVIHAVGPMGEDPEKLQSGYEKTLELIDGEKIRSVGLCCLSTGIYGYPIRPATKIALDVVRKYLEIEENRKKVDRIIFVVFLSKDCKIYDYYLPRYFPLPEGTVKFQVGDSSDSGQEEQADTFTIED